MFTQREHNNSQSKEKSGIGLLREACPILPAWFMPERPGCQFLRGHCLILQKVHEDPYSSGYEGLYCRQRETHR